MTGKEIIAQLKSNILAKMKAREWETIEIDVKLERRKNDRVIKRDTVLYEKNGKKEEESFGLDIKEYDELLILSNRNKIRLYITSDGKKVAIYADEPIEEFSIEEAPMLIDYKQTLYDCIAPSIENDETYVNEFYVDLEGVSRHYYLTFFHEEEGVAFRDLSKSAKLDDCRIPFEWALSKLIKTFPLGKKIKVSIHKNQPIEIIEYDISLLLTDIELYHKKHDVVEYSVVYQESKKKNKFIETLIDGKIIKEGELLDLGYSPRSDYAYLYLALGKSINVLDVKIDKNGVAFKADKDFSEYGITLQDKSLDVASDDLETLCQYIESGRKDKIDIAIKAIGTNQETRERLNQRYLNYVRAFSQNKDAQLEDISTKMFSEEIKDIFFERNPSVGDEYIEFGYCYPNEAKRIIDFIGAMTSNYIDIEAYKTEHKEAYQHEKEENFNRPSDQMKYFYRKWYRKLKTGLSSEIKLNAEGWYSQVYKKLLNSRITKIQTDKSEFYEGDEMPYLEEYMFFLSTSASDDRIYIDVYNSINFHNLTEVFWMFESVPQICWFQSTPKYTPSPYGEKKQSYIKIDNDEWQIYKGEYDDQN